MLRDDNGRWALYLKPTDENSFSIYPDKVDLNRFFTTMKQGEDKSAAAIRIELAQKYYALAKTNPALKQDLFGKPAEGVDLSRIERVNMYKAKGEGNSNKYMIAVKIAGDEGVHTHEITQQQWQRIWVTDDAKTYKTNLAATVFADLLTQKQEDENIQVSDFPNLKQVDELKAKHPDAIILMRKDEVYESYREDAAVVADVCGIDTFDRVKSDTHESVTMTSFKAQSLDTYLPKLVRAGHRIAICEALEPPKQEVARNEDRHSGMKM
jgi:hypothetical protein